MIRRAISLDVRSRVFWLCLIVIVIPVACDQAQDATRSPDDTTSTPGVVTPEPGEGSVLTPAPESSFRHVAKRRRRWGIRFLARRRS
jgi:hypothetical protein